MDLVCASNSTLMVVICLVRTVTRGFEILLQYNNFHLPLQSDVSIDLDCKPTILTTLYNINTIASELCIIQIFCLCVPRLCERSRICSIGYKVLV